jgi:hypothetical protein
MKNLVLILVFVLSFVANSFAQTVSTINFSSNSAVLKNTVMNLELTATSSITVIGHTDSRGSEEYNLALSLRRAEEVKSHLVSLGYSADLITVIGKGESQPLSDNSSVQGRATNRRVEIVVSSSTSTSTIEDIINGNSNSDQVTSSIDNVSSISSVVVDSSSITSLKNSFITVANVISDTIHIEVVESETTPEDYYAMYDSLIKLHSDSVKTVIVHETFYSYEQEKVVKKAFKDSVANEKRTRKAIYKDSLSSLKDQLKASKESGDLGLAFWTRSQIAMLKATYFKNDYDPKGFFTYYEYIPCYPNVSTLDLNIHRILNYSPLVYPIEYAAQGIKALAHSSLKSRARYLAMKALQHGSYQAYINIRTNHYGGSNMIKYAKKYRNLCKANKGKAEIKDVKDVATFEQNVEVSSSDNEK